MSRGGLPALAGLEIADDPGVWDALGFDIGAGGIVVTGDVAIHLAGAAAGDAPAGIRGWALRAAEPLPVRLDGIPTRTLAVGDRVDAATHPNAVSGVDHVVVTTPDLERTLTALRAAGMEVRRTREAGSAEHPLRQAFLWAGDVLVEVAGPPQAAGEEPARLWGLVLVVPDVDALAERWGAHLGTPRDAVQPGRRIVSLGRQAGSSVRVAFMTPHQRAGEPVESGI